MIGPFCGFRNGIRNFSRRHILLRFYRAFERVARFDHDAVARTHRQHGIGVGADRVMELALLRLSQFMRRRRAAPADTTLRNDRGVQPVSRSMAPIVLSSQSS